MGMQAASEELQSKWISALRQAIGAVSGGVSGGAPTSERHVLNVVEAGPGAPRPLTDDLLQVAGAGEAAPLPPLAGDGVPHGISQVADREDHDDARKHLVAPLHSGPQPPGPNAAVDVFFQVGGSAAGGSPPRSPHDSLLLPSAVLAPVGPPVLPPVLPDLEQPAVMVEQVAASIQAVSTVPLTVIEGHAGADAGARCEDLITRLAHLQIRLQDEVRQRIGAEDIAARWRGRCEEAEHFLAVSGARTSARARPQFQYSDVDIQLELVSEAIVNWDSSTPSSVKAFDPEDTTPYSELQRQLAASLEHVAELEAAVCASDVRERGLAAECEEAVRGKEEVLGLLACARAECEASRVRLGQLECELAASSAHVAGASSGLPNLSVVSPLPHSAPSEVSCMSGVLSSHG